MITCQDILELQLDGVELIAGEKGLTRPVTWTYMVQTRPFAEHMNQGNFALCVVDYVRFDLAEAQKAMEAEQSTDSSAAESGSASTEAAADETTEDAAAASESTDAAADSSATAESGDSLVDSAE